MLTNAYFSVVKKMKNRNPANITDTIFDRTYQFYITLYVAIVPANACQHTKFKLSSSISFGDMSVVLK